MKVILKEEIQKLGIPGDIVNVADGFARNYLFPQKKALPATEQNVKNIEHHKKVLLKKASETKASYEELAQKLSQFNCTIQKKVGKNNKLFGSVTSQDIYQELHKNGFSIDRRTILLEEPIKTAGDFHVPVKLHPEVTTTLTVTVKALS